MGRLDHVNIQVVDGPRMVRFLETVLDAKEGPRPPGIVNHVAFGVYDFEVVKARIESSGWRYRLTGIPETGIGQFFVEGPEGLLVEVQYRR